MTTLADFRKALLGNDFLVLDSETTGLERGEVVQIAIINNKGETLLDTLVKPAWDIPAAATMIHGIKTETCNDAPTWMDIAPTIKTILEGKLLVVYNANYDRKIMHQTAERWGLPKTEWKEISTWLCAMDAFAEHFGEWNDYHQSYRWQRLSFAAKYCKVTVADAHNALGDCKMALGVTKHMLEYDLSVPSEADGGDDETD